MRTNIRIIVAGSVALLLTISGCGTTTERPPFEGMLPTGTAPITSQLTVRDVVKIGRVSVALTKSTHETVKLFEGLASNGYPLPTKLWVSQFVLPLKETGLQTEMVGDLSAPRANLPAVLIHWTASMSSGNHGSAITYYWLDADLKLVKQFTSTWTGNCNSHGLVESKQEFATCYDKVMQNIVQDIKMQVQKSLR